MSHGCPPDGDHFGDNNLYRLDELIGSLGAVETLADDNILCTLYGNKSDYQRLPTYKKVLEKKGLRNDKKD